MKLALTAGGTGGHVFPALAVYDACLARGPVEVRFFGPDNRGERALAASRGITFEAVPAAAVRGRGPIALGRSAARIAWGIAVATRRLRAFGPDAVFSTGGYGSFPCSVAARLLRRPLVVFLPDVTPGWAVRAERRLATRVATTTEAAVALLGPKTRVTGYPVRPAFFTTDRAAARAALGLPDGARVLVVAGASQGASAINAAIFAHLAALTRTLTVVHVSGAAELARARELRAGLPPAQRERYLPAAFRDDLPCVMVAADLAVMRAGASVLGELPAAGLPAILVPGTYAGGHQRQNARWLAERGAALVVEEPELPALIARIEALFADTSRLAAMAAAARALAVPGAAGTIVDLLEEVARR